MNTVKFAKDMIKVEGRCADTKYIACCGEENCPFADHNNGKCGTSTDILKWAKQVIAEHEISVAKTEKETQMFKVGDKVVNNRGEVGVVDYVETDPEDRYPVGVRFNTTTSCFDSRWYSHTGERLAIEYRTWEHRIRLYDETQAPAAESERVYKVGDKIKVPHAEELLLRGWETFDDESCMGLTFPKDGRSSVKVEWCGKEVEIKRVFDNSFDLEHYSSCRPEHLGLPKIKQPKPEPKVGEFWRTHSGVVKILSDRREEGCDQDRFVQEYPFIVLDKEGSAGAREDSTLIEKVTGWEG